MDIGKALTYYTKDEKFVSVVAIFSLLILSCIFLLPIFFVGPLFVGYTVELVRRIQNGDYSLPEIQYGDQWKRGLLLVIVQIAVGFVFGMIQFAIIIPFAIMMGVGNEMASSSSSYSSTSGSLLYSLVSNVVSYAFSFVTMIISFMMVAIYAKTDNVNALFKIDNYKKLWANNGANLIILPIISSIVGGFVALIGLVALCIGILPASVISMLISAGFNGQVDVKEIE